MEAGVILSWLVKEGESYEPGEPVYEVETEKSQVEAKAPGAIAKFAVAEGETAPVGAVLAVVADPGESLTDEQVRRALDSATPPTASAEEASTSGQGDEALPPKGPDSSEKEPRPGRIRAMPRAKRLAAELGVDLASVHGTDAGGAITEADVRRAAEGTPLVRDRRRLTGLVKAQAERMTRSWGVPQFSQDVEVDTVGLNETPQAPPARRRSSHRHRSTYRCRGRRCG